MQNAYNPFNGTSIRIGPTELREAFRYYTREVTDLQPKHYLVLMFILDRTIGWDKVWEIISVKHLSDGVRNVSCGFKISERTVYRAIDDLIERGLINVIILENNNRMISLARYSGFLTRVDENLFGRKAVDLDEILLPMWQNPTDELSVGE